LNSVANQKVLDESPFQRIFIQPAASDEGIALGAALYAYHQLAGKKRFFQMRDAYLGKTYSEHEIRMAIEARQQLVNVVKSDDICKHTAELLANKKIVGWFQGGSEVGPRALGHRSILCDPRDVEMRDYLNDKVKHREPYRPFAPAVLAEYMDGFNLSCESPFMLLVAKAAEHMKEKAPAIVHIDGTARVQTVKQNESPFFYRLIKSFNELTGVPVLLNTSFNVAGEPIVESPADALNCFLGTNIDVLIIHDYIITKR
jgi:carbamoyltransferase